MKFIIAFTWLILISISAFSQTSAGKWKVEDGWNGLLPFKSTGADVEKLLGKKSVPIKNPFFYQFRYETDDAVVSVGYAGAPCDENSNPINRYDLPADAAIRYEVLLKGQVPVSELTFNENRFEPNVSKDQAREVGFNQYQFIRDDPQNPEKEPKFPFSYRQYKYERSVLPNEWSSGIGIKFWGLVSRDVEYVRGIEYGPSYDDLEKYRCRKTEAQ